MHLATLASAVVTLAALSKAVALPAAGLPEPVQAAKRAVIEERNPFDPFGIEKRQTLALSRSPLAVTRSQLPTTSTAQPSPTSVSDAPPNAWATGILDAHNAARKPRSAPNLVWNAELTTLAKAWGERCGW